MREYKQKLMTKEEAVSRFVEDGDIVSIGGLAFAVDTVHEIVNQVKAGRLKGITMVGNLLQHPLAIDTPGLTPDKIKYKSFFYAAAERALANSPNKNTSFFPIKLEGLARYVEDVETAGVSVCQVTPPNEDGNMSLGPVNGGTMPMWLEHSKRIIVQVNRNLPFTYGPSNSLHVSRVCAITEHDEELPIHITSEVTEVEQKIADLILEHIPDGACIQLGLGGMANAIGYGLRYRKELGIHTEMFTESMRFLHEQGVITNSRKQFMPGVSVAGFALGNGPEHYKFLDHNKDVNFWPYSFTNSVENIAKNDNQISINAAMSIDLTGQVAADTIGFKQFSGTGGQVDFVRGALASKNGKSFIAFSSTVDTKKEGRLSRIVLDFPPGVATTTLRSEVQYVVTEYGCVNLYGMDLPTRAKRLIGIAHPDYRDQLAFEAKKAGLLY
jgi:acyl-CoA hydrolase